MQKRGGTGRGKGVERVKSERTEVAHNKPLKIQTTSQHQL